MEDIFKERLGVTPEVTPGYNYNDELLEKSLNSKISEKIANYIVKLNKEKDFCVVDCYSLIGSTTFSFLEKKEMKLVVSCERHAEYREMLKRNINSYGENFKNKSIVLSLRDESKSYISLNPYKGSTAFINSLNVVDQADIVNLLTDIYANIFYQFVIYYPIIKEEEEDDEVDEKEELKNKYESLIGGYRISIKMFDDFYLVVGKNEDNEGNGRGLKKSLKQDESIFMKNYVGSPPKEKKDKDPISLNTAGSNKISWKKFCDQLTPCDPRIKNDKRLKAFQSYIKSVLIRFVPEGTDLNNLITEESMKIWTKSIVHETYSLTYNYESLETIGDSMLAYVMIKYLMVRFPDIEPAELNELKARYMSKEFQYIFTNNMKLDTWILVDEIAVDNKIKEDVFEAFVGALVFVGDNICPGLGQIYSYNFITLVMSDTVFDMSWKYGKAKSQLQQRGNMLKLNPPSIKNNGEESDEENEDEDQKLVSNKNNAKGGISFIYNKEKKIGKIEMTEKLIKFLKEINRDEFRNPLVEIAGANQKITEDKAWESALIILNRAGYTAEFTQTWKEEHTFDGITQELVVNIKKKAKKEGFTNLIIKPSKSTVNKKKVFLLIGYRNGIKSKLAIGSDFTPFDAKIKVLRNYLDKPPPDMVDDSSKLFR